MGGGQEVVGGVGEGRVARVPRSRRESKRSGEVSCSEVVGDVKGEGGGEGECQCVVVRRLREALKEGE